MLWPPRDMNRILDCWLLAEFKIICNNRNTNATTVTTSEPVVRCPFLLALGGVARLEPLGLGSV